MPEAHSKQLISAGLIRFRYKFGCFAVLVTDGICCYIVSGYKFWISHNKPQIRKGKPYLTRPGICQNL